jgi:mono/diheme cytochrome c family protein
MLKTVVTASLAALLLALSFGTAAVETGQDPGRMVFERRGNCATCHGPAGGGSPLGPDLTDAEWLNIDGSVEQIADVVRKGVPKPKKHPAPMPPMGGARLKADEISAVAQYVYSMSAAPQ